MGTLEEQLHFLTHREVLLQMVGKGSNNNPHGWSLRPATRRSQKTYPRTAHWAELFNSNSKVTLNPHKLQRSLLGKKKKNNVKAR